MFYTDIQHSLTGNISMVHVVLCILIFYISPICFWNIFSSSSGCVAAQCCHINTQWSCCILLTFQWQGLVPISQWDSWVTCSFSGVFSQTKSFALPDMPFPWHKNRVLLSNKKKGKVGRWELLIFHSQVLSVALNILWQHVSRGVMV